MANRNATVKVELLADATKYKRGMAEASQATDKFDKKTDTTKGKLAGFGQAAHAFLVTGAAVAVGAFVKSAIDSFSNLEQSIGGTEAVFKGNADEIGEWADGAAENFGLSEAAARTATTAIGGQLKRMTGDLDFATEHSKDLVEVAADLAATYGGTTAEAVDALGAAFRGEADPAERFNLDLKIGKVNAKALELGLADASGAIDDQARAQALLALITEQSTDAVGQFGREQDTVAGQTQILTARLEDQKAEVGEKLAPAWMGLQRVLLTALDVFADLHDAGKEWDLIPWTEETDDLASSFESLGRMLGITTTPAVGELTRATEDARTHGIEPLETATWKFGDAQDEAGDQTATTTGKIREQFDLIDGRLDAFGNLTEATQKVAEKQALVNQLIDKGKEDTPEYLEAVEDLAGGFRDVRDAEIKVAEAGGVTREEFIKQQVQMGLAMTDAVLLADKYDELFTPREVTHTIRLREIGDTQYSSNIGGRHSGGTVPGDFRGQEVLIKARVGEHVSQGGRPVNGNGHGGGNVTINVSALDPQAAAKAVVQALQAYQRSNGAIPINTR